MFFLGQLASTISLANIQSDIIGLVTGSITATSGLSTSFVAASSPSCAAQYELLGASAAAATSSLSTDQAAALSLVLMELAATEARVRLVPNDYSAWNHRLQCLVETAKRLSRHTILPLVQGEATLLLSLTVQPLPQTTDDVLGSTASSSSSISPMLSAAVSLTRKSAPHIALEALRAAFALNSV